MNRIFLALLALFAGIAAQVSPAEARVRGETEIGATMAQGSTGRAAASAQVPAANRIQGGVATGIICDAVPVTNTRPAIPTVLVGPDRARE